MTTRSEREKAQKLNDQHQAILTKLLREEDNKYCADCEAKGPRWASWNLGVFMCIRCAGIHRNLGVHISRVKSVNLDQWTPEQIQSMIDMGNQRAKLLYEAHLPEGFRRPQTDQAVEVFIRDKYERKKYYDQEALATIAKPSEAAAAPSSPSSSQADRTRLEKEREKKKEERKKERDADKHNATKTENKSSPKEGSQPAVDLLGLDTPVGGAKASGGCQELDIFGPMVSNPLPSSGGAQQSAQSSSATAPLQAVPSATSTPSTSSSSSTSATTKTEQKKLLSKDSILSLYASSPVASQTHNQQQQQQQQQAASGQAALYGAQFQPQGFSPGVGGAAPHSTMMGGGAMMGLANGSYMGVQQQQQGQWGVAQMTQQMSGVAVSGGAPPTASVHQLGGPVAAAATTTWPAAPPASSGQTLSTQLWK